MGNVIEVENLSKKYRIFAARYRHDTLKDQLGHGLKKLLTKKDEQEKEKEVVWALKDISFKIGKG